MPKVIYVDSGSEDELPQPVRPRFGSNLTAQASSGSSSSSRYDPAGDSEVTLVDSVSSGGGPLLWYSKDDSFATNLTNLFDVTHKAIQFHRPTPVLFTTTPAKSYETSGVGVGAFDLLTALRNRYASHHPEYLGVLGEHLASVHERCLHWSDERAPSSSAAFDAAEDLTQTFCRSKGIHVAPERFFRPSGNNNYPLGWRGFYAPDYVTGPEIYKPDSEAPTIKAITIKGMAPPHTFMYDRVHLRYQIPYGGPQPTPSNPTLHDPSFYVDGVDYSHTIFELASAGSRAEFKRRARDGGNDGHELLIGKHVLVDALNILQEISSEDGFELLVDEIGIHVNGITNKVGSFASGNGQFCWITLIRRNGDQIDSTKSYLSNHHWCLNFLKHVGTCRGHMAAGGVQDAGADLHCYLATGRGAADGEATYFTRKGAPRKGTGKFQPADIYFVRQDMNKEEEELKFAYSVGQIPDFIVQSAKDHGYIKEDIADSTTHIGSETVLQQIFLLAKEKGIKTSATVVTKNGVTAPLKVHTGQAGLKTRMEKRVDFRGESVTIDRKQRINTSEGRAKKSLAKLPGKKVAVDADLGYRSISPKVETKQYTVWLVKAYNEVRPDLAKPAKRVNMPQVTDFVRVVGLPDGVTQVNYQSGGGERGKKKALLPMAVVRQLSQLARNGTLYLENIKTGKRSTVRP